MLSQNLDQRRATNLKAFVVINEVPFADIDRHDEVIVLMSCECE